MNEVIIFKLKEESGFFDATELKDDEMHTVPKETVCLSLENSMVTDIGIEHLPDLLMLRCIDLDTTQVTNLSMEKISTFKSLEEIWIEDTLITDEGFKKLADLPNLKFVSFWNTKITDEAFDYVMNSLPNLKYEG